MNKMVFVLGDSRTGTTTVHKFLKLCGFTSIHYFFKESGVVQPAHIDFEANWQKLATFIDNSEYNAFSDYPTRTFYKELIQTYPDAYFIMTTRKAIETWQKSMNGFFKKFNIDIDIENLTRHHERINEDAQRLCEETGAKFCRICIDDDADINGETLSGFLELDEVMSLGWENSTDAYDNSLWSSRVTLYNTKSLDFLTYVKRINNPSKAMLSEYGWVFLINDSSDFLDYCYGDLTWPENVRQKAVTTLKHRHEILDAQGISYLKFGIPEKSIVYPQFLPKIFEGKTISETRPAVILKQAQLAFFSYPDDLMLDARSYGHLYFRGDSHPNWLGSFFLYQHIVEKLNAELLDTKRGRTAKAIELRALTPSLAGYGGDIFVQIDKEMAENFKGAWRPVSLNEKMEYLVQYTLPAPARRAKRVPVEQDYIDLMGERETFRFSHSDKTLPKAVIFRDSTSDFLIDLLAEHFSESLFIWHKGRVYEDVLEREKPEVVLHVMAERFLTQYQHATPLSRLGLAQSLPETGTA